MNTWKRRIRGAATAAAVTSAGLAAAPLGAVAAGSHHSSQVRHFDTGMLDHTNRTRLHHHRHQLTMNPRLWRIAHAYARHLAHTGTLSHNPRLTRQVSRACPSWTALGENVGVEGGDSPRHLFRAYMHSAPHRANILDHSYTEVGIASVKVRRHGRVRNYNVIDFARHCPG